MLALPKLVSFVRVAECGSFSAAALLLDIAHSGLSRQVQELETELGYRLLQRTGRGVRLTEQGRRLYEQARVLIAQAEAVHDEARTLRGLPVGTVTIGLPGSASLLLGSSLLVEASRKYPQVRLRLIEGLSSSVEEMLAVGRIDFGLFFAPASLAPRKAEALFASDLHLVGRAGDPALARASVPTTKLDGLRLILPGRPNAIRMAVEDACAKSRVVCNVAYEADSLSTMKRAVEVGAGYTVTSWDAVAREVKAGVLAASRLTKPTLGRVLYLETARHRPATMAARVILDAVRELAASARRQSELRLRAPDV